MFLPESSMTLGLGIEDTPKTQMNEEHLHREAKRVR